MLCELSYHEERQEEEEEGVGKLQIKSILCRSHKAISRNKVEEVTREKNESKFISN